eukprot:2441936-Rhodomonas_salina.1
MALEFGGAEIFARDLEMGARDLVGESGSRDRRGPVAAAERSQPGWDLQIWRWGGCGIWDLEIGGCDPAIRRSDPATRRSGDRRASCNGVSRVFNSACDVYTGLVSALARGGGSQRGSHQPVASRAIILSNPCLLLRAARPNQTRLPAVSVHFVPGTGLISPCSQPESSIAQRLLACPNLAPLQRRNAPNSHRFSDGLAF